MVRYALLLVGLFLVTPANAEGLPRATPESQGIASSSVVAFLDAADERIDTLNSVMVVRRGKVVAEGWWAPYRAEDRHVLYSLSKSFTSTAVGLAIAEGKMSLDDRVVDWFPHLAPESPSNNLRAMRVRDLLRMATGHRYEALRDHSWSDGSPAERFLSLPVAAKPGTLFVYNTPATYMCSAIVQRATGERVDDYLRPRLFEPLGIEGAWWERSIEDVAMGGFGLNLRTEDIAKFGQLLLQRGEWEGEQLVPSAWVDEATALQIANGSNPDHESEQGYGYQFWRCTSGGYRGDGAFGQFCLVLPEEDAVVAMTCGTHDLQGAMKLVWKHLQAAMGDGALPEDADAQRNLKERLASLTLSAPKGGGASPEGVSGAAYRVAMDPLGLRGLRLVSEGDATTLTFANDEGRQRVVVGRDAWRHNEVDSVHGLTAMLNTLVAPPRGEYGVAAQGGWTEEGAFAARLVFNETPFYVDLTLRFEGDGVTIDAKQNVVFGGDHEQPTRVGAR